MIVPVALRATGVDENPSLLSVNFCLLTFPLRSISSCMVFSASGFLSGKESSNGAMAPSILTYCCSASLRSVSIVKAVFPTTVVPSGKLRMPARKSVSLPSS
jgi:hypothetical protein